MNQAGFAALILALCFVDFLLLSRNKASLKNPGNLTTGQQHTATSKESHSDDKGKPKKRDEFDGLIGLSMMIYYRNIVPPFLHGLPLRYVFGSAICLFLVVMTLRRMSFFERKKRATLLGNNLNAIPNRRHDAWYPGNLLNRRISGSHRKDAGLSGASGGSRSSEHLDDVPDHGFETQERDELLVSIVREIKDLRRIVFADQNKLHINGYTIETLALKLHNDHKALREKLENDHRSLREKLDKDFETLRKRFDDDLETLRQETRCLKQLIDEGTVLRIPEKLRKTTPEEMSGSWTIADTDLGMMEEKTKENMKEVELLD